MAFWERKIYLEFLSSFILIFFIFHLEGSYTDRDNAIMGKAEQALQFLYRRAQYWDDNGVKLDRPPVYSSKPLHFPSRTSSPGVSPNTPRRYTPLNLSLRKTSKPPPRSDSPLRSLEPRPNAAHVRNSTTRRTVSDSNRKLVPRPNAARPRHCLKKTVSVHPFDALSTSIIDDDNEAADDLETSGTVKRPRAAGPRRHLRMTVNNLNYSTTDTPIFDDHNLVAEDLD